MYRIDERLHLIVIYKLNYLIQIFEIEPTVQRVDINFTWDQLFGPDEIVYALYVIDDKTNSSKLIINQREDTKYIGAKYNISIYDFDMITANTPDIHLLISLKIDRRITNSILRRSVISIRDFVFIYQGYVPDVQDSVLYISYLD